MNKIESVTDVADLLQWLSGSSGLSSRVQDECKKGEAVLRKTTASSAQTTASPSTTHNGKAYPSAIASAAVFAKPWVYHATQISILANQNVFEGVAEWLGRVNNATCAVELISITQDPSQPRLNVLYRFKQ